MGSQRKRERLEGATLLALKMEDGAKECGLRLDAGIV